MKNNDNEINQNEIKIGIYKITNFLGESYIGQAINIKKRKKDYFDLRANTKNQPKIFKSLIENGIKNHIFEVLEECLEEQLNERERYYKQQFIDKYGWDKALFYFIDDKGGGLKGPRTKETKDKIGRSLKGREFTKEWKDKISERKKDFKYSKEARNKISKSNKGKRKTFNNRGLPILQYSLDGNFIKEWKNTNEVLINFPELTQSSLIKVCRGERNYKYKGYLWKRKKLVL